MGIDTLPGADNDPISSFADTQSLSSDTTGKSARFPSEILQHIADHERDKVQERWDKLMNYRPTEALDEMPRADIAKKHPQRRSYWVAHVYDNADTYSAPSESKRSSKSMAKRITPR
jgi:hypothetical protein